VAASRPTLADYRRSTVPPVRPGRLLPALALAAGLAGACADGDQPARVEPAPTDAPSALAAFLGRAARAEETAFTATYDVLRKLGPVRSTVMVATDPPVVRIDAGDLVVVDGPRPATCRRSSEACDGELREEQLAALGLFSGFFSTGPVEALRSLARRPDAGEPSFTRRNEAGVELECVSVPVDGRAATTSCITGEGVFGYVDNPAATYRMTRYAPGPPGTSLEPPYPVAES
jgi:hypothetical protein